MDIKKEIIIDAPSEIIFTAITNQDKLTQWFPDVAKVELCVGGQISFKFLKDEADNMIDRDYHVEGKIIELIPNKKLIYTWMHPDMPEFPETIVTWMLEEIGNMTKVTLTHTGFTDENTIKLYNDGWSWFTGRLSIFARDVMK